MNLPRRSVLSLLVSAIATAAGCLGTRTVETTVDVAQQKRLEIRNGTFRPASIEVPTSHYVELIVENRDERPYVLSSPVLQAKLTVAPGETIHERVKVPSKTGRYELRCADGDGVLEVKALPDRIVRGCGCAVTPVQTSDDD